MFYRYKDFSPNYHCFHSVDEGHFYFACMLSKDKYYKLPKIKTRWFQFWRQKKYDKVQALVSEIREKEDGS